MKVLHSHKKVFTWGKRTHFISDWHSSIRARQRVSKPEALPLSSTPPGASPARSSASWRARSTWHLTASSLYRADSRCAAGIWIPFHVFYWNVLALVVFDIAPCCPDKSLIAPQCSKRDEWHLHSFALTALAGSLWSSDSCSKLRLRLRLRLR